MRDVELFKGHIEIEVGLSITTADEGIRQLFEPNAPSIKERIQALNELHLAGVRTFTMVAPLLPKVEKLATSLFGKVDHVLLGRMNYHYGDWVYKRYRLEGSMSDNFFSSQAQELTAAFEKQGIDCQVVF